MKHGRGHRRRCTRPPAALPNRSPAAALSGRSRHNASRREPGGRTCCRQGMGRHPRCVEVKRRASHAAALEGTWFQYTAVKTRARQRAFLAVYAQLGWVVYRKDMVTHRGVPAWFQCTAVRHLLGPRCTHTLDGYRPSSAPCRCVSASRARRPRRFPPRDAAY